jgi:hypothetical protein
MVTALFRELRITEGTIIATVNARSYYRTRLGDVPAKVTIGKGIMKDHAFIQPFVQDRKELEHGLPKVTKAIAPEELHWTSYPKGGNTDLSRDTGWDSIEGLNMRWMALIAFDDDRSAFLLKNTSPTAPSKAHNDYHTAQAE